MKGFDHIPVKYFEVKPKHDFNFFFFFLLQPLKFSFTCKFGISFVVGVLCCCQWDKVGSSLQPYTCVILFWCVMPLPLVVAWSNELRRLNCTLSFMVYSLLYRFYMYHFSVGWNVFLAWCYGNEGTWVQTLCDGLRVCLWSVFASSAGSGAPQSPRMRQSWACALSEDSFRDIFEGPWMLEAWNNAHENLLLIFVPCSFLVWGLICSQPGSRRGFSLPVVGFTSCAGDAMLGNVFMLLVFAFWRRARQHTSAGQQFRGTGTSVEGESMVTIMLLNLKPQQKWELFSEMQAPWDSSSGCFPGIGGFFLTNQILHLDE